MEIQQEINAVTVGDDLVPRLRVPANSPALRVERWYIGESGGISYNPYCVHIHQWQLVTAFGLDHRKPNSKRPRFGGAFFMARDVRFRGQGGPRAHNPWKSRERRHGD